MTFCASEAMYFRCAEWLHRKRVSCNESNVFDLTDRPFLFTCKVCDTFTRPMFPYYELCSTFSGRRAILTSIKTTKWMNELICFLSQFVHGPNDLLFFTHKRTSIKLWFDWIGYALLHLFGYLKPNCTSPDQWTNLQLIFCYDLIDCEAVDMCNNCDGLNFAPRQHYWTSKIQLTPSLNSFDVRLLLENSVERKKNV